MTTRFPKEALATFVFDGECREIQKLQLDIKKPLAVYFHNFQTFVASFHAIDQTGQYKADTNKFLAMQGFKNSN